MATKEGYIVTMRIPDPSKKLGFRKTYRSPVFRTTKGAIAHAWAIIKDPFFIQDSKNFVVTVMRKTVKDRFTGRRYYDTVYHIIQFSDKPTLAGYRNDRAWNHIMPTLISQLKEGAK